MCCLERYLVSKLVRLTDAPFFLYSKRQRRKAREQEKLAKQSDSKQMRRLLRDVVTNLMGMAAARSVAVENTTGMMEDGPALASASILDAHEVVFVFTDIEESTSMAAANPEVYT